MSETDLKPRTKTVVKTDRPKLHKVILFNDWTRRSISWESPDVSEKITV